MPILREDDPRIGCLAVPISAAGGFVLFMLLFAAVGASAGTATMAGLAGALVGAGGALLILRRQN